MRIDFNASLDKNNKGIDELFKLLSKKGSISFDFKKGSVSLQEVPISLLDSILSAIRENFEITSLELNKEPKFKIRNDEKELNIKKAKLQEEIAENPSTLSSQVRKFIFEEKVFTLTSLREAFPKAKFATIRGYVNRLKKDNLLIEIERGKYTTR